MIRYGIGAILIVFLLTSGLHFGYTPDETYVYLTHAKSIASGEGFSSNAGSAVSAPLWTLLVAVGTAADLDPYIVAKALDLVFAGLAVIAVLAFAFILIRDPVYALVAACIFSCDASFLRWTGSGMESSLATLLLMLTLWYSYKKEYVTASLIAGLLTLVRPEGILLLFAVAIDVLLVGRDRKSVMRILVRMGMFYSTVVGVWILISLWQSGDIGLGRLLVQLPSSQRIWGATRTAAEILGGTQLLTALSMVTGVILALKKIGWPAFREDFFPLIWILAVPVVVIVAGFDVDSRTILLISPLVVVYGVWGIKRFEVASLLSPRHSLLLLIVLTGLSLAQNQWVYSRRTRPHMENYQLGVAECLKPMGYWLQANTAQGAKVLACDIGVIGYISGRETYRGAARDQASRDSSTNVRAFDYVIDRSPEPVLHGHDSLRPIMTRTFSGYSVRDATMYYYTLSMVIK